MSGSRVDDALKEVLILQLSDILRSCFKGLFDISDDVESSESLSSRIVARALVGSVMNFLLPAPESPKLPKGSLSRVELTENKPSRKFGFASNSSLEKVGLSISSECFSLSASPAREALFFTAVCKTDETVSASKSLVLRERDLNCDGDVSSALSEEKIKLPECVRTCRFREPDEFRWINFGRCFFLSVEANSQAFLSNGSIMLSS
mmetsp:Transcript_27282/g.41258  ORF Transcript_27282/g.41258 Transcript_27282/m.41258 type:complete len:206 (-) Transcript_27282:2848-3465(-)